MSDDARGDLAWRARPQGSREILKIDAKVRFGTEINEANVDQGAVYAIFPDGTACELEGQVKGSEVRYRLVVREHNGVFEEKRGACAPSMVPAVSGGSIEIVHDDDDDPSTPNTTLLTGNF